MLVCKQCIFVCKQFNLISIAKVNVYLSKHEHIALHTYTGAHSIQYVCVCAIYRKNETDEHFSHIDWFAIYEM